MGLLSRMTTVFKAKASKVLDRMEDPRETLDYSYERQMELLRDVQRNLTSVVASKKRLELQTVKLNGELGKLEDQARAALAQGREDLARVALERKRLAQSQIDGLAAEVQALEQEQAKLTTAEQRLQAKVQSFRTKKELVKAKYSVAEAQVRIGEAVTGLSEEFADVGLALERAQEKTENMVARAAAIDELVAQGTLQDPTHDPVASELEHLRVASGVEEDLVRLRAEAGKA